LTLPLHESFSSESSSLTQSLTISSEEKDREGRESVTSMVAIKPHYENVESANIHPQEQFVDVSLEAQNTQLPYINHIVMISIILHLMGNYSVFFNSFFRLPYAFGQGGIVLSIATLLIIFFIHLSQAI
jgi:hypothetical protein